MTHSDPALPTFAFTGGRILTMDPAHPSAEVVVTSGDRIVAVGDRTMLASHPHARRIDLAGRVLVPGFIDAHGTNQVTGETNAQRRAGMIAVCWPGRPGRRPPPRALQRPLP